MTTTSSVSNLQTALESGDRKGTTKKLCDKDFAERSGELSDAFFAISDVLPAVFRLFYRDPLGTFFRLFSGCFQGRAFGTSVDDRRDCNAI